MDRAHEKATVLYTRSYNQIFKPRRDTSIVMNAKGTMSLKETGSDKQAKKPVRRTDQRYGNLERSSRNYDEKFKISFCSTRFSGTKKPIIEEAL